MSGTPVQIALAEWLFNQMDQPAPSSGALPREYRVPDDPENVVRMFYLVHPTSVRELEECAVAIRTVADIRRLSTYGFQNIVVARGTPDQMALTEWLVKEMDQPSDSPALAHPPTLILGVQTILTDKREYQVSGSADDIVRVMHLANTPTVQDFQEVAVLIRTIADIRRVFTYNGPRLVVARGTADQIALAAWLTHELDQPSNRQALTPRAPSSPYQYTTAEGDHIVKVFYLTQTPTVQEFQAAATNIRKTTNIRRVFTYNGPRAMAIRGTADQIAHADRLVGELRN
jgi:hypothetical protein